MGVPVFSGSLVLPVYVAEPLFSIFPVAKVQSSNTAVPFTTGVLENVQLEKWTTAPFWTSTTAPSASDLFRL